MYQYRYRELFICFRCNGTGIEKKWYGKNVSEPVLVKFGIGKNLSKPVMEKFGTVKSTGIGIVIIWYRKKSIVSGIV